MAEHVPDDSGVNPISDSRHAGTFLPVNTSDYDLSVANTNTWVLFHLYSPLHYRGEWRDSSM